MFMVKYPIDRKMCGLCKFWVGDAKLKFCPAQRVELDIQAKGECREKSMLPMRAGGTCPRFQKRVDL